MVYVIAYLHAGSKRQAVVEIAPGTPFPARILLPGRERQDLPLDSEAYAYTHGGEEYRAAVDAAHEAPWWSAALAAIREAAQ